MGPVADQAGRRVTRIRKIQVAKSPVSAGLFCCLLCYPDRYPAASLRKDNLGFWRFSMLLVSSGRIDDECASPFSDNSGLRSGDLDPEEGAIRWSISLVWTY